VNKGWGIVALVVVGLYWLQAVLIPLALAVLLTFLWSPVVGDGSRSMTRCSSPRSTMPSRTVIEGC
jgi:predicted PurR-regulated permease PerM